MSDDIAISIKGVSKDFVLPHDKKSSVKSVFTGLLRNHAAKKSSAQHALRDISFDVKKGEFFGIVGRNGSGKSTLLKIIAEIYRPTKGTVTKNGRLVPFIELGVGFNPELTGRENVYLNGALLGFTVKEIDAMYNDVVAFAELEDFMDQKLKNYSSGMQVRLAFSVATRAKADILLIDEVLAVGDADFQRKCFNYFKSLKSGGTTVIFVSHDMGAIREYCDRAMLIDEHVITSVGVPDSVAQQYAKLFIEDAKAESQYNNEKRWGEGGIYTESISVAQSEEAITVNQLIRSENDIEDPVVGLRIRSISGADITGTNTKIENKKIGKLSSGLYLEVVWSIPNIFAEGEYYIDPTISAQNGITVLDWWDEAARFAIRKDRKLPYDIDPGFGFSFSISNRDS